jgi:Xaa-Pro aminopeptidase
MHTMHLALPVGEFDFEENPLGRDEFEARVSKLQSVMAAQGWGGVLVFGEIHESGLLTYYSNYAPRLSPAMVLIPREGAPRVLTLVGGRMVPAGALTTWIEDVRPAGNLAESLGEWLAEIEGQGSLATADLDLMQAGHFENISDLPQIIEAVDATEMVRALVRRKSKAELALMTENCSILAAVERAVHEAAATGQSPASCSVIAEKTARNLGAQDARCLYSPDGGVNFYPFEALSDEVSEPFVLYVALKQRGYWVDGFVTVGEDDAHGSALATLDEILAATQVGVSYADLDSIRSRRLNGLESHPVLNGILAAGIGVSPTEMPVLKAESSDALEAGDVVSVKVALFDGKGGGFASAVVKVSDDSCDILWKSS